MTEADASPPADDELSRLIRRGVGYAASLVGVDRRDAAWDLVQEACMRIARSTGV
jgi:DNA-directed RNA polymerase specialized sigma24 family protein